MSVRPNFDVTPGSSRGVHQILHKKVQLFEAMDGRAKKPGHDGFVTGCLFWAHPPLTPE